jgi:hypothetical protein
VGAYGYSSNTGRAYIFYNDGIIPDHAPPPPMSSSPAKHEQLFRFFLTSGDFNADGKTDLAVGANGYSSSTGRVPISSTMTGVHPDHRCHG